MGDRKTEYLGTLRYHHRGNNMGTNTFPKLNLGTNAHRPKHRTIMNVGTKGVAQ